jgi:hypothetical protein
MLAYLVLSGKDGAPVDEGLIRRFDQNDLPEIPFRPDDRIVWRNYDGSVVFFGWQAFTEVAGIGSHWVADEHKLTAFTGHCWPRMTGWAQVSGQSWASQLRAFLGDAPALPDIREELFGQFTIVSLPSQGTGWAVPDWAGIDQFFDSIDGGVTALSNRAGLCARAVTPPGSTPARSLTGAGWLVAEGWMLDQETGYWDVERPRAGSYAVIEPGQSACIVEPQRSPLFLAVGEEPTSSYEEILADAERDLRATLRAIAALPLDDRMLSLSGGKDSRTLTALIISEGLQDKFRFATHGSLDRADAIAAQAVAERFDLDWSLADATNRSPDEEMENVLIHTWLMEGMTSAWGTFFRPEFSSTVVVSGVAGEGLRWGPVASSAARATSTEEVLAAIRKSSPLDPLRALRPDARAYYLNSDNDWVHEQVALGIPLVSISAIYKQEPLVHSRNGPDYTWSPRMRINPYLAPSCLRSNHRLPLDQRPDFRFHLDLQRTCSIELSKMPFADKPWSEPAYRHLPDAADYRQIEPIHSRSIDGRTWRQKRYTDYRKLFEPILFDLSNPLHELLDFDRLAERVATGDHNPGRTRLIWGVLTAAVWMAALEQPMKFERESEPALRIGV